MESYLLFLIVTSITFLIPGPGVLLTLTNSIRYGFKGAISGILGIAFGTLIIAAISATSVGVILATSALAFTILKYIGAMYLIYLGIKLWNSSVSKIDEDKKSNKNKKLQFVEGVTMQMTNPKSIFYFMSVFPQFINFNSDYMSQFIALVLTYSFLVIVIHFIYAFLAKQARTYLSTKKGRLVVNKTSGGTFIFFGFGLALASK